MRGSTGTTRPVVIRRSAAVAFAAAGLVALASWIATAAGASRMDAFGPQESRRAEATVAAARSALAAFDLWRSAAESGSVRRAAALEQKFADSLERAADAAESASLRGAVTAIKLARRDWRDSAPLDARFAALGPALDAARAAQLRLHLAYFVEAAVTESLEMRRGATTTAAGVAWTGWLAALSALAALAAAAFIVFETAFGAAAGPPPAAAMPEIERAALETRLKAARRLEALRAFEARRRMRTDVPFALRGSAPAPMDG